MVVVSHQRMLRFTITLQVMKMERIWSNIIFLHTEVMTLQGNLSTCPSLV